MPQLSADRGELARFVSALFRYADADTFASLRAFHQFRRDVPPEIIQPIKLNGDLQKLIDAALRAADRCAAADHSIVFAPPICTFTNPDRARGVDLANGLTLSVELDEGDTVAARRTLESLIGLPTVVVASGGDWADPETGEIHTKLHLHWRLSEPTRAQDDHVKLAHARDMAARLVGADPTGKPVVHPLRWPGSWNTKDKPRLARIVTLNETAEIHLDIAADAIAERIEAAGLAAAELPRSADPQAPRELLESAMQVIPNADVHYDQWVRLGYASYRGAGGSDWGFGIWDRWSRKSEKYNATETETVWKRISHAVEGSTAPRTIGAGTIFFMAAQAGWKRPPTSAEPPREPPQPPEGKEESSEVIRPHKDWLTQAPLREWIVEGWIPRGYVTGLYGDGGVGKSLMSQQLLTSVASVLPWLGMQVRGGHAFGLMCEDDNKELHRRQESINDAYGLQMRHLENLHIWPRLGFDNLLMVFDQQSRPQLTELFAKICAYLDKFPPALVVLDTLSDIFGGDELKRAHARVFVQGVGGRIARRWNCGVVIAGHPSAAGLATKSGTSGSTAWNNTFRSRIYVTRPEGDESSDRRLISRMKANYAPKGAEITAEWNKGCFVVPDGAPPSRPAACLEWEQIDAIFSEIDRAWKAKDAWSNSPQTRRDGRYLPLWAQVHLGAPEKLVAKQLEQWLAGKFLTTEIIDGRTKSRGLRVVKRLRQPPQAEE